ncbi:S8 family serine peptidase [Pseudomaricurvus alkylphenolicus]|jgi:hypothetical protein|uniref:subtilisin-like serine protease QhpE n=1 Tax=Pseudomaricurvus alkylphenolicus TaxID=1306991 RepID=UPI001423E16C|nr:S8 family serine peptidase [Pseudomaricurvus alkylphenolicus]NIB40182.1 S8 family serine peptidase [Pseudomaricurvus alkylphenolicus]
MSVKVGLLDSGLAPELVDRVCASVALTGEPGEALIDRIGHGTPLSRILWQQAPGVGLLVAKIFDDRPVTSADAVAQGIRWLVDAGADVINMSFGLRENRDVLREACDYAEQRQVLLVASTPARGARVFPASYAQVVSVTGDIRCSPGEFSNLQSQRADFGACPYYRKEDQEQRQIGGASFAVPYICAGLAKLIASGLSRQEALLKLRQRCRFQGEEQR